jgi:hypothetical protein
VVDVDAAALELHGLTPDELTAARNAMAKATKDGEAAAIKAPRKPTLATWLANLLVRTEVSTTWAARTCSDRGGSLGQPRMTALERMRKSDR